MIKNINNKIYIIEDYISPSTAYLLTNTFNKELRDTAQFNIKSGPSLSEDYAHLVKSGSPIKQYGQDHYDNISIDILTMLCTSMSRTVSEFLNKDMDLKTLFYSAMFPGSKNVMHFDNHYKNMHNGISVRTNSENDWSGLLYLNYEYEGGILNFPTEDFSIKPNPGTFIFFQGDDTMPHEVTEVTSGIRNAIVSFFWPKEYRGLEGIGNAVNEISIEGQY